MSLTLEIPHDGKIIKFDLYHAEDEYKINIHGYEIEYDISLVEFGEEISLPLEIYQQYREFGVHGLSSSWRVLKVVGEALSRKKKPFNCPGEDSTETLMELYWMYQCGEKMIEHANQYHDGDIESCVGAALPMRGIKMMDWLEQWVAGAKDGLFKEMPDIETFSKIYRIKALESVDPRVLWFNETWSICDRQSRNNGIMWACVDSKYDAAYMIYKHGKPVGIFWAWRATIITDDDYPDSDYVSEERNLQDEKGEYLVIDAIHTTVEDKFENLEIFNVIANAAHELIKDDPSIKEVRVENKDLCNKHIAEFISSSTNPWHRTGQDFSRLSKSMPAFWNRYLDHPTVTLPMQKNKPIQRVLASVFMKPLKQKKSQRQRG